MALTVSTASFMTLPAPRSLSHPPHHQISPLGCDSLIPARVLVPSPPVSQSATISCFPVPHLLFPHAHHLPFPCPPTPTPPLVLRHQESHPLLHRTGSDTQQNMFCTGRLQPPSLPRTPPPPPPPIIVCSRSVRLVTGNQPGDRSTHLATVRWFT